MTTAGIRTASENAVFGTTYHLATWLTPGRDVSAATTAVTTNAKLLDVQVGSLLRAVGYYR